MSILPLSAGRRQVHPEGMRDANVASAPREDTATRHTIVYAVPAGSRGRGRRQRGARRLGVRPYRVTDKVMSRALGASLDRQLAAGREPEETRLLAARAQEIVTLAHREALARYWERTLAIASRPGPALRNSAPLRRGPVLIAGPAIAELARLLRAPLPVSARGVAMARSLLTDAGGPLYWSAAPESLHAALRAAITRLDPELPVFPGG
jgi:hypothetical protein